MQSLVCDTRATARCDCVTPTELIWDGGNTAMAIGKQGQSLAIGDQWRPDTLFSVAVESDLMQTFLALTDAAALEVVAYVSAGQMLEVGEEQHLYISVCIVMASASVAVLADGAWHAAREQAALARTLGPRLHAEAHISSVGANAGAALAGF